MFKVVQQYKSNNIQVNRSIFAKTQIENIFKKARALIENICRWRGIEHMYSQMDEPNQNAFIQWFDESYRVNVCRASLFSMLNQVDEITDDCMRTNIISAHMLRWKGHN